MTYEEMKRMEETHWCAECDMPLVTIWDPAADKHQLVCARNHRHQGYARILTQAELLGRGRGDQLLGPGGQKDIEARESRFAPALDRMPKADIATGRELTEELKVSLVTWANSLGLNAFLGHVCLYFGKPYVTIDGYYYKNNKREEPYRISTHPLNQDERTFYQLAEGDHAWVAEAWGPGNELPVRGLGIVTREEIEGKSTRKPGEFRAPVVHSHPQRMAEKRAEWQLLRKLLPLEEKVSPP